MGALTSRQNQDVEEDSGCNNAYKYPPRAGNFFGSHFIMGGERFDTPQPESYLFGENVDLNFLGNRPTAFPYPPPQTNEPTKTLKSLINIRKESVRFVKSSETIIKNGDGIPPTKGTSFNIEFIFDSDANCSITIYYFSSEEINPSGVQFNTKDRSLTSETYHYKKGVNQYFSQPTHTFNPHLFSDELLTYKSESDNFPVAIHCVVEEGSEECRHSHTTICVIDHHSDGTYVLRALKQKIFIDGLCYLLQEIYGIENKTINKPALDDETDDNGSECVICMSDMRDTLILPCRHLCLCNSCADSLRYQANNCPICRAPFRALLQIKAVKKGISTSIITPQNPPDPNCEHIPTGYIPVSLIEALNGPPQRSGSGDNAETPGILSEHGTELNKLNSIDKNAKITPKNSQKRSKKLKESNSEYRMSIILNKNEEENSPTETDAGEKKQSPVSNNRRTLNEKSKDKIHKRQPSRESLKIINERHSVKLQSPGEVENDSDVEKLSPLLINSPNISNGNGNVTLQINETQESVDDTDAEDIPIETQKHKKKRNRTATAQSTANAGDGQYLSGATAEEDSDYFTPEDPHTTILSPLCPEKDGKNMLLQQKDITSKSVNDLTSNISSQVNNLKDTANSLPDSPISGNSSSTRSSADSYSSSSATSTKHLLSSNQENENIKKIDDKQKNSNAVNV